VPLDHFIIRVLRAFIEVVLKPFGANTRGLLLLSFLRFWWIAAGELVHHLLLVVSIDGARHHNTVNPKAQDVGHILQQRCHLSTREVEGVGLWTPMVNKGTEECSVHLREPSHNRTS
jgi:hypothetical protein